MTTPTTPRRLLRHLFDVAVAAADPARCVPPHLPPPAKGRTVVVGAGKAAAAMAQAVEDHWSGDPQQLSGLVVTRYGHGVPCRRIEVVEAGHPMPDEPGREAAQRILRTVSGLGPEDRVLALISGGGSALLALPAPGISLADKQAVTAPCWPAAPPSARSTACAGTCRPSRAAAWRWPRRRPRW